MSVADRILRSQTGITSAPVVITRPSETSLLCVSSQDRYDNYAESRTGTTYPFSFNIARNQNLVNGTFTRAALSEFRMVWALPNISAAWGNNTILITEGGNDHLITLPDQFYDPAALAETLQQLIQAEGAPLNAFTVTQDATSGVLLFASNNGTAFQVNPVGGGAGSPQKQLFDMLNMPYGIAAATSTHSGIPNLRATDYIDVVATLLTQQQHLADGSSSAHNRNLVARIYLDDSVESDVPVTTFGATTGTQVTPPPPAAPTTTYAVNTTTLTSPQGNNYGNRVNGVSPFRIYRQFSMPKQIGYGGQTPIGSLNFELYDDQGRSIQTLWNAVYPPAGGLPNENSSWYINACAWNMTLLLTSD